MSFASSDISALPAHVRALFEQAGRLPGPSTQSAVGGYGSGLAPTNGNLPSTGGYISPFGGAPFPFNMDTGGAGMGSKPGGYGATPEKAVGETVPSMPMRVRPISRTRQTAMRRGYSPSTNLSQYLPRNYVNAQLQQANATPAMRGYYG